MTKPPTGWSGITINNVFCIYSSLHTDENDYVWINVGTFTPVFTDIIPSTLLFLTSSPQSAGELENDEHTAAVMMQMIRTASRFRLPGSADPPFKRMSGTTHTNKCKQCTSECLTFLACLLSNPGRFRLRGDSFWPQSLRGQTSEQPAGASQRLEVADTKWRAVSPWSLWRLLTADTEH